MAGELLGGRYRLLHTLGSGGMGTVWRADDTLLGRQTAVKEVTFPPGTSPAAAQVLRERTRREARSAARLSHPHAVTLYDVVEEGGRPWLVMELVEAPTLAQVVADEGPLPVDRVARVGLALLSALEAAHARGILHRDVKPSNVLLAPAAEGRPERPVLTDFGIATTDGDSSLTSTGLLLGSPAYIPPERAAGEPAGPPSDLWSLGATLFTAAEGHPPYDADGPLLTVTAVLTRDHAPFVLSGPLAPALDGLLEKDPARRLDAAGARRLLQPVADAPAPRGTVPTMHLPSPVPPTASTAALSLGAVQREVAAVQDRDDGPSPATHPAPRPAPAGRRRTRALAAGAAAVAVAATATAVLLGTHRGSGDPVAGTRPTTAASSAAPRTTSPPAATRTPPPTSPPAASTPAAPSTPAAAGSAAGTGGAPAGTTTRTGGPGWSVAVPTSWQVRSFGGFPEYRDPATGRALRVSTGKGQPDPVADRQAQARSFRVAHPTYAEIGITPTTYQGHAAADWEFTFEGVHVLDRVFVVGGTGYSLWFQAPAAGFAGAGADLATVFATFRPAG